MLNKNYVIIGVVILAIVMGVIFWSRNNSSVPDAVVLEQGVKNLTRESAAKKIEEYLRVNPQKVKYYAFDEKLGHYSISYGEDEVKLIKALEAVGLTKIVEEKRNSWGLQYLSFDFTDKAKPYLAKPTIAYLANTTDTKNVNVLLAEVTNVEVTGITEPAQGLGGNQRIANYTAQFKLTPIGEIIDDKQAQTEIKSQMPFMLYDDGWRIIQ